jgi:hypothetical protein
MGRFESSSHAPTKDDPKYAPAKKELQALFDKYQQNGHVQFPYKTLMIYGKLL